MRRNIDAADARSKEQTFEKNLRKRLAEQREDAKKCVKQTLGKAKK